ncbi:hypothetical protein RSAG8_07488, partial [Rhizoctonia solani AG-8 WAC10335]
MDHPPLSIAALTVRSKPTGYDINRSFKTSLNIAMKECDAGLVARAAEDVEQAFIHFTKAYILFVEELPTHPRFVHLEPYKQNVIIGRGKEVDIWRSEMKVLIKKRVWEWDIRHLRLDAPITTRPRVQSESGVSGARSRLKPTPPSTIDLNSGFSEDIAKHSSVERHKRTVSDAGVSNPQSSAHGRSSRHRSLSPSNRDHLVPSSRTILPDNPTFLNVAVLRTHLTHRDVQPLVTTIPQVPGSNDKDPSKDSEHDMHSRTENSTPEVPTLILTEPTGEQSPGPQTNSEASSIETPDGEVTFPTMQHHNDTNNDSNPQLPEIEKTRPRAVSATLPHWRAGRPPMLASNPQVLLGPRPGSCPPVPMTKVLGSKSSQPFNTTPAMSFDETCTVDSSHRSNYFTAPTEFESTFMDDMDVSSDPEHPESIAKLEEEALAYLEAEKFEKATDIFMDVLDLRRRIQGDSHLFTIQTMSNLGLGYEGQGELDQAIGILCETLIELNNSHSSVNVVFRSPIEERLADLRKRQAEAIGSMTIVRCTDLRRGAKRTNSIDQIATRVRSNKTLPFNIDSNTTPETIMAHLTNRRCPDLTHLIDTAQCSAVPVSEGGYGDIWKGVLIGLGHVAMKSLRVNNGRGKLNKRLAQELYAWSKADHENVLKLLGLAYYKDSIVMISPWMQYGSINAYLEQHPDTNRLHIAIQIADGIAHLHRIGMVHGDLKAQNVFVSQDGIFKVGDFGLAVLLGERSIAFLPSSTGNNALGTMRWMAPELFMGGSVSLKSDIYSLGMTIYELVSGRVPFWELTTIQFLAICMQKKIPTLPLKIETMGKRGWILWDMLCKCWDVRPQERPTADQVLREVHKAASH